MIHTLLKTEPLKIEVMEPIKTSLESMFCPADGWKLYNKYNWANKCYDIVLQKESLKGYERIIVSVNLDSHVTSKHYENLHNLSRRLTTGTTALIKKILVFDRPATFEAAPADVELISIDDLLKVKFRATEPKLVA
ncbi:MAG: hypothetical protein ACHQFW_03220 [Chitinophagales bacterium]